MCIERFIMKVKLDIREALSYHAGKKPGKFEIAPTKPLSSQKDLSLAYTPGVALPCLEIQENPDLAYTYTTKGNTVAVISNGTAVLGLGNLGALASKPVMEGKAVLFKKFADVDSFDLEVNTENVDDFVHTVRHLGAAFGGINLEDIKAPECFLIEEKLKASMDIPIFHDDQHGTAICVLAALLNALELANKSIKEVNVVLNGAGAAAIACAKLLIKAGLPKERLVLVDRTGVIYKGRTISMNPWKEEFSRDTIARTLQDAAKNADVLIGVSAKNSFTPAMIASMAPNPIIFAMANPDPEITPEQVQEVRTDAIVATGRSDYPNQVNNALCFPYLFRGALDVRATAINDEMKIAAAKALAALAKEDVTEEVADIYPNRQLVFSKNYIIPVPFDSRLMVVLPAAVAKAAMDTGVAQKPIEDFHSYADALRARKNPLYGLVSRLYKKTAQSPLKKIVFAQGEEEKIIRAAVTFHKEGLGKSILIGHPNTIYRKMEQLFITSPEDLLIYDPTQAIAGQPYKDFLKEKVGHEWESLAGNATALGSYMLATGQAHGMVAQEQACIALQKKQKEILPICHNKVPFFLSPLLIESNTFFLTKVASDTPPTPDMWVDVVQKSMEQVEKLGLQPHIIFVEETTNTSSPFSKVMKVLADEKIPYDVLDNLSYLQSDGDIRTAQVLIFANAALAKTSLQLLKSVGRGSSLSPIAIGFEKAIQMASENAKVFDLITLAVWAATDKA